MAAPPLLLPFIFLLLFAFSSHSASAGRQQAHISVVVSDRGLVFVKDLLVDQAVHTLTPLHLPDIEKSVSIPIVGRVRMGVSNITLSSIRVNSSSVQPGDSGIVIVASGATANLSLDWFYSYSTWLVPIKISDKGSAFIQVERMEVGITLDMENHNGTLMLNVTECDCYINNLVIKLDGGASWFYQGFINAFAHHIRSAAEDAITKKITEKTLQLDSLLQTVPKKINVDKVAALNATFVNDPVFGNTSVELDFNGLFIPSHEVAASSYLHQASSFSNSCGGASRMLSISLDEAVFNSASFVYFQAGLMHWIVDKIPGQSLLNTASWKLIIPKLYGKYPNDDMLLNITLTSPPVVGVTSRNIGASIILDMTVLVLDGSEIIPVTCISVAVRVSGIVEVSGNNLTGQAALDDFTLTLKWSDVGNFHMFLIQGLMKAFLNTVLVPYVNVHLRQGFPLPVVRGFTLQNANVLTTSSTVVVCSDIVFNETIARMNS